MLGARAAGVAFYPLSSVSLRVTTAGILFQFLFSGRIFPCPCRCFLFLPSQEYMKPFCCGIYRVLGLCKLFMSASVWESVIEEPQQCSHCSPLLTAGPAFLFEIVLITYDSNLRDSLTHWCFSVGIISIFIPGPSDLHKGIPTCLLKRL